VIKQYFFLNLCQPAHETCKLAQNHEMKITRLRWYGIYKFQQA